MSSKYSGLTTAERGLQIRYGRLQRCAFLLQRRSNRVSLRLQLPGVRLCPLIVGLPDRLYPQPGPGCRPGYIYPRLRMCLPQAEDVSTPG